jgi:hypothetical protein
LGFTLSVVKLFRRRLALTLLLIYLVFQKYEALQEPL